MPTMHAERGPSPAGPLTVTLSYTSCDKARSKLVLKDALPAGMRYVAGSGRWSGAPGVPLTDAILGDDWQGSGMRTVAYDFGVTTAGTVTATIRDIPAETSGWLSFQVEIVAGLAKGTLYLYFRTKEELFLALVEVSKACAATSSMLGAH